jgi:hypothetical protein
MPHHRQPFGACVPEDLRHSRGRVQVQAQRLVQRFPAPLGKGLQIAGAPGATAQEGECRHRQREPQRRKHYVTIAAIGNRREKGDQIIRCAQIGCSGEGVGHLERRNPLSNPNAARDAKGYMDKLLGGPVYRAPAFIRADNRPEFIAQAVGDWCEASDTTITA